MMLINPNLVVTDSPMNDDFSRKLLLHPNADASTKPIEGLPEMAADQ